MVAAAAGAPGGPSGRGLPPRPLLLERAPGDGDDGDDVSRTWAGQSWGCS